MENTCAPAGTKTSIEKFKDKFKLGAGKYNGTFSFKCDACEASFQVELDFRKGK